MYCALEQKEILAPPGQSLPLTHRLISLDCLTSQGHRFFFSKFSGRKGTSPNSEVEGNRSDPERGRARRHELDPNPRSPDPAFPVPKIQTHRARADSVGSRARTSGWVGWWVRIEQTLARRFFFLRFRRRVARSGVGRGEGGENRGRTTRCRGPGGLRLKRKEASLY